METKRVVVTGMGAITPLGNNVETFWNGLVEGKVAIGPITKFDTTGYKATMAGEVKDFDPTKYMDFKTAKRMELFSQYAVAAACEAVEQSGLDMTKEDPFRVGVIVSSGIGSMQANEREHTKLMEGKKVNPFYIPMMISNMASANIAIKFGMKGKNIDIVTACASGSHSIGDAFKAIKWGDADVMLAGGAEAAVCPLGVQGFISLTALSNSTDPMTASRPFDKDRDGFVIGEGSGVVVLEELEHAKARGAKILAEVVGYGATNDAYHITSPAEDGSGAGMAMKIAMKEAGIEPKDVDYINAHGTSTHHNDLFETRAIKYAFGDEAKNVAINSTKSMIGHLLGGAGGVEFIVMVKAIENSYVHVTAGSKESEEELDLDYTFFEGKHRDITYAMSNNLGFGGHNATILIKKYEE
ncbi:3-oxoacyl-[acyl-carrier-protein] synthase II [Oscillospiraceae bacterium]|nr:3-oxoacyl-[acyl-carrier-protein] synthase II [Oscillospiraceae bacterium]